MGLDEYGRYSGSVAENLPPGAEVITITATDRDEFRDYRRVSTPIESLKTKIDLSIFTFNYRAWSETLYHRDDTLLYIAYVMLIWAAPIPAERWHCSVWP